ncbi:MAG: DUF3343 domain-containing protein [Candidatus Poribacteria bacterium]
MNTTKPKTDYGIVLFDTTQAVIKAEKILNSAGIKIKLIPVPRHISSNCGISILFDLDLMDKIKLVLSENNIYYRDILPF